MPFQRSQGSLAGRHWLLGVFVFALAATALPANAEPPSARTLALKDKTMRRWEFFGDNVVSLKIQGDNHMNGTFTGYSLADLKPLWEVEAEMGNGKIDVPHSLIDHDGGRWFAGTGPLSLVDMKAGTRTWTLGCNQVGVVVPGDLTMVGGDKLLFVGSEKCAGSLEDALEDPRVILADAASGKVLWSHDTKPYKYDVSLGYWARVRQYQGGPKASKTLLQMSVYPVGPGPGGKQITNGGSADQVLVVAEHLEGLSLADGRLLWKSKEKAGVLRGVFGRYAFFRSGDDLSAYDVGSGAKVWTYDLKRKGVTVYTPDDIDEMGDHLPEGMSDVFVSEAAIVSRVDGATGQPRWSVKRTDWSWQATEQALMVSSKDRTMAYDWETGAKRWEVKTGHLHAVGKGDVLLFVDRGKYDNGSFSGPYEFTGIEMAAGRQLWSRQDVEGRRIVSYTTLVPGQVRLVSDKGAVLNVNISDGSPATAPDGVDNQRFLSYANKSLTCRDYAGQVVWERKEEQSEDFHYRINHGRVVWATKKGTVEVIALADGASVWKMDAGEGARPWIDGAGHAMVVQKGDQATVVTLPE